MVAECWRGAEQIQQMPLKIKSSTFEPQIRSCNYPAAIIKVEKEKRSSQVWAPSAACSPVTVGCKANARNTAPSFQVPFTLGTGWMSRRHLNRLIAQHRPFYKKQSRNVQMKHKTHNSLHLLCHSFPMNNQQRKKSHSA